MNFRGPVSTQRLRELPRVAPVGFHPFPGLHRNRRSSHYDRVHACRSKLSLQRVAARARLVADPQLADRFAQSRLASLFTAAGSLASSHSSSSRRPASGIATWIDFLEVSNPTSVVLPTIMTGLLRMRLCRRKALTREMTVAPPPSGVLNDPDSTIEAGRSIWSKN